MGSPIPRLLPEARQYRRPPWSRWAAVGLFAVLALAAFSPGASPAATAGTPTFTQTNLVSDIPGLAATTDPNLVNPWGMTLGTNSGLWVAENGKGTAESFD